MCTVDFEELGCEMVLYLTTTGRRTGLQRTIEIWFVTYQQRLYLLAEHRYKAHWVRNILVDPAVAIRMKGYRFQAHGRVLDHVRDCHEWQAVVHLSQQKYGWGDGLPVAFEAFEHDKVRGDT